MCPVPCQHGITEVKVEKTAESHILHLQTEDTLIQLEEDGTHIVCNNNEPLCTALRDLVLHFLMHLNPLTLTSTPPFPFLHVRV